MSMSISLDGYFEGPNREIDWHLVDAELHAHFNTELRTMGAFLDGRITYQLMAGYWPTADQAPGTSKEEAEFARIWRDMPKLVYSTTLERADWNTTVVGGDLGARVRELKAQPGGNMLLNGGADVATQLADLGLLDEIQVFVHPVVLGDGKRLFPLADRFDLKLVHTRSFDDRTVLLSYEPVRPADE